MGRVVNFGFNRACNLKPQLAEFQAQGLPGNPQQAGGLVLLLAEQLDDLRPNC